jgi:formylglycine-generating enzyme required for sulfatase activity
MTEANAMVLVLLPAGQVMIGAQAQDATAPNFDPQARPDEAPVHAVSLAPFFLSKFEMTQGQWQRAMGTNPSCFGPGLNGHPNRWNRPTDLSHPVEQVSWISSARACLRLGMCLPSEEQWEYAARAGITAPFWTGPDPLMLSNAANLADLWYRENGGLADWACEAWSDGSGIHAPVGMYRQNPFGLQDILGNVWEWCSGEYGPYLQAETAAVSFGSIESPRVHRGGSYQFTTSLARSSARGAGAPDYAVSHVGLRPARAIDP